MYVYLVQDDVEHHGTKCACDLCDHNGKSHGVAIYDMTPLGITHLEGLSEWAEEHIKDLDPLSRVYAPSQDTAYSFAEADCKAEGWTIITHATPKESIRDLLGALQGLVGDDGYLTERDLCECDNTHEQNHTVCSICWARYYYEVYSQGRS